MKSSPFNNFARRAGAFALAACAGRAAAAGFSETEIKVDGRLMSHAFRDVDGDGRPDAAIAWGKTDESGAPKRFIDFDGSKDGGPYVRFRQAEVPDDVVAWGLGDFLGEGRPQLVYFTPNSFVAIPADGGAPKRLLENQRFFFNRATQKDLPYWDYIQDLNGDGLEDLILADATSYLIFLQSKDHKLTQVGRAEADLEFATIEFETAFMEDRARGGKRKRAATHASESEAGPPPAVADGGGWRPASLPITTKRALSRLILGDVNGDKRPDIVTMRQDKILVYAQGEGGKWPEAPTHTMPIGPQGFKYAFSDDRLPVSHGDVNGDGKLDFVLAQLDTKELTSKLSLYLWGEKGIPAEPNQIIKVTGLGDAAELVDANGDGKLDLAYITIRADKMLAMRKSEVEEVDATYYVYLFDAATGAFSRSPDMKREFTIAVKGDSQGEKSQKLENMLGDYNGDGARDLMLYENRGKLQIFLTEVPKGSPMKAKLPSSPTYEIPLEEPEEFKILDLNGDGKSDIVLQHKHRLQIFRAP